MSQQISDSLLEQTKERLLAEGRLKQLSSDASRDRQETTKQFDELRVALETVRNTAREALTHTVGVDGQNGLRGTVKTLATDVKEQSNSIEDLRKSLDTQIKSVGESLSVLKLDMREMAASMATQERVRASIHGWIKTLSVFCVIQLGTLVWWAAKQDEKAINLREDVNKLTLSVDKLKDAVKAAK